MIFYLHLREAMKFAVQKKKKKLRHKAIKSTRAASSATTCAHLCNQFVAYRHPISPLLERELIQ